MRRVGSHYSKDLTQLEIPRLEGTYNLTDGHAHRPLSKSEMYLTASLPELFAQCSREQQPKLEAEYLQAFYGLASQSLPAGCHYLLLPGASISLEIVANYLRLGRMSLALIEPCFDNLANIFRRHHIPLEPFSDNDMKSPTIEKRLSRLTSDAICIVSPNNPTGTVCSVSTFSAIVNYCKLHNKLLILDSTFRFYKPNQEIFDEYKILSDSGIDFIVIEDTGKTWPTKELKFSILAVSEALYAPIYDIYTDFLYHHSPFTIKLLTDYINHSRRDNLASIHKVVGRNRLLLAKAIKGTCLQWGNRNFASVAWLEVHGTYAQAVVEQLAKRNVFTLPGSYFFWSDPRKGDHYLRISLVRDPQIFARAMLELTNVLRPTKDHTRSSQMSKDCQ